MRGDSGGRWVSGSDVTRHEHRVFAGLFLLLGGFLAVAIWSAIDPEPFRTFYSRTHQEYSLVETRVIGVASAAALASLLVYGVFQYWKAGRRNPD